MQNRIAMINAIESGDDAAFADALDKDTHLHSYCVVLQRLCRPKGGDAVLLKKALEFPGAAESEYYSGAVSYALSNIVGNATEATDAALVQAMVDKLGDDNAAKTRVLSFAFSTAAMPGQPLPSAHIAKILVDAGADVNAAYDVHAAQLESQRAAIEDTLFRLQRMRTIIKGP